jgi:hypothetical protein
MKTLRTVVLILAALVVTMTHPAASGLVGIYGVIERVVFEPTQTAPERLQVWGAFAFADGGVGNATAWSSVRRGHLYFRLPAPTLATASDIELIKREWEDIRSVAGTAQAVAFGRWGYIGRFDTLVREGATGPAMFLERAPKGGAYTDLRVRPAADTPSAPAAYQTNAGVVRLTADGSHANLVAQLRAAVKTNSASPFALQTGPPVAAMPDPANPGQKKFKNVAFVVRSSGCADLGAFHVTANADSVVNGVRRSVQLKTVALPQSGVFGLTGLDKSGAWVVSLSATCGPHVAGATVRLTNGAYRRDGVELLPRHPTPGDVDRALAHSAGGGASR